MKIKCYEKAHDLPMLISLKRRNKWQMMLDGSVGKVKTWNDRISETRCNFVNYANWSK